jgi:hypothetical protein
MLSKTSDRLKFLILISIFVFSKAIETLSTQADFLEQLDTTTNGTNETVIIHFLLTKIPTNDVFNYFRKNLNLILVDWTIKIVSVGE